jgi:flavin-dependent dehydrogenase
MDIEGWNGSSPGSDELAAEYDVVVAGGGVAGLSGALVLGRSRRRVAVIDAGSPRNGPEITAIAQAGAGRHDNPGLVSRRVIYGYRRLEWKLAGQ